MEIEIPCVVPVGSTLYLPTPRAWEAASDAIYAEITNWDVAGGVLSCSASLPSPYQFDAGNIEKLEAIGYTRDEPKILEAAYQSIVR